MYSISKVFAIAALFGLTLANPLGPHKLAKRDWVQQENVWDGRTSFVNSAYAKNMAATAASFRQSGDEQNARRAEKIAREASTFNWYTSLKANAYIVPAIEEAAAKQRSTGVKQTFPLVIYNMPDRDCGSEASNGELQFNKNGLQQYAGMIDTIVAALDRFPELNYAISLEPDSIANMVTNIGVNRCQPALFDQYIQAYATAIKKLQKPNISIYIDIAHGQWLGWPDSIPKTVKVIERIMTAAGPDAKIRGYCTNVSNYQPYKLPNSGGAANPNYDEFHYATSFAAEASKLNLPTKFVIDTGRGGRPEARKDGVWCNLIGAGYGRLPSSDTDEEIVDAYVWIKPPGDSDGSSQQGPGYDTACTGPDNLKPSPQPGGWFLEYSKMLLRNANPQIQV